MDVFEALERLKRFKYLPMEKKDRKLWEQNWRKRTVQDILKEGTVWGCRDAALLLKHWIGEKATVVEGVRLLRFGGHVWIEVNGRVYDGNGEFDPLLSKHGPYIVVKRWENEVDPYKDWDDWRRQTIVPKLAREAAAIAYAAFGTSWLFYHTVSVVHWVEKLEKEYKNEAILAAWLHDIGRARVDEGHAELGARWAEEWLKELGAPEESITLVVDGIRNHGSSARPETSVGHTLRLADALSLWEPWFIGMLLNLGAEREKLRGALEKKWEVIREYGREDLVNRERILQLLEGKA